MFNIKIRPAEIDDADTIYQFICCLENLEANQFDLFRQCYQKNLHDPNKIHLVAQSSASNKLVGYVSCYGQLLLHHLNMVYEIQEMFVTNDFRRIGVGKCLLTALENILQAHGCVSMEVTTNKVRMDALRFYEQNGFVQTHFKLVKESIHQ